MGLPTVIHYRRKLGAYWYDIQQYSAYPAEPGILGRYPRQAMAARIERYQPRLAELVDEYEARRKAAFRAKPDGFPMKEKERAAAAQELVIALQRFGGAFACRGRVYGYAKIAGVLELTRRKEWTLGGWWTMEDL